MARAIDSEAAYRFLSEQLVKETGAFSKGVNKGLNIARSAMRNPDAIPTLTQPNETPPCYQPDGDGCAYQCYDGDDEPIDKCKECPLCYSDKQRHHAPPNEPLTLDELREMDGEPVWVEEVEHWALIDIEKSGQWAGIPFAVWAENGANFTYNIEGRELHCFRRPPEGEEGNG